MSPIAGAFDVATSVPAELSLRVLSEIACRTYPVYVDGETMSGESASESVEIDVERADTPIRLAFLSGPGELDFGAIGDSFHMNVLATFSDGRILDVTESSRVTYRSSNTKTATVDRYGRITPVGSGHASVSAIYTNGDQTMQVTKPVNVQLGLTVSSYSLTFGAQAIATTSTPELLTLTNTSSGPISVVAIEIGNEDFGESGDCPSSTPLPVGGSCTILVSFKPTEAGHRISTLTIINSFTSDRDVISLAGTAVRH